MLEQVCCYLPAGVAWGQGVSYEPLPLTWKLEVRMYRNDNCNPNAQVSYPTYGFSDECIPAWLATPAGSAGYGFLDKIRKRDSAEESANSTQACTSRQQVDTMGFADGSQYNITGFSADMYTELLDFATGNKRMAELPEELRVLRLPHNVKESKRVRSS